MITHPPASKVPHIDASECQTCKRCEARKVCRTKAILALDPGEAPFIDGSRCHGCMVCVPACPFEAVVA